MYTLEVIMANNSNHVRKTLVITPEQRRKVYELACEGKNAFDIGAIIDVPKRHVMHRCKKELLDGHDVAIKNGIMNPPTGLPSLFEYTNEVRFQIAHMAGLGLPVHQIAIILGVSENNLYAHAAEDIARGRAEGHKKVAGTLFEMATDAEHPSMTTFYLKSQCGWKEATQIEFPDENGKPQSITAPVIAISAENVQMLIAELNDKV
jgi:hypothetical protein